MVGFIVASAYLALHNGIRARKIAVIDPNGFFKGHLKNSQQLEFSFPNDVDTSNYKQKGYQ
jgi:ABC-2 type transport system permease protein